MSGYSSESNYKSKVKENQADCRVWLNVYKFSLFGMHKLVQVRNRCRNVWIMSLSYTYIIVSGSFLFSGFNPISAFRTLCCLQLSTNVSWIKCCAFNRFTSRFRCRQAVLGDRQKGRWPWQPLMSIDGRVAESSRLPHSSDNYILFCQGCESCYSSDRTSVLYLVPALPAPCDKPPL